MLNHFHKPSSSLSQETHKPSSSSELPIHRQNLKLLGFYFDEREMVLNIWSLREKSKKTRPASAIWSTTGKNFTTLSAGNFKKSSLIGILPPMKLCSDGVGAGGTSEALELRSRSCQRKKGKGGDLMTAALEEVDHSRSPHNSQRRNDGRRVNLLNFVHHMKDKKR
ncbi:hypothetical protein L2E82_50271 [Cichorium intybus]|nr:hypothetical protein L2E82_50271 [Cichorium intybus]